MTAPTRTIRARWQQRGRTAAEWTSLNEVLLARERGIETDTRREKLGDGETPWNSLQYLPGGGALPDGGTTGQLLAKASDDDQDTEWIDAPGGGGGTSLSLPSQAEAEDGTTETARAWSSLRDRQALEAWYGSEAPEIFADPYSPPTQRDLNTYLQYVESLQRRWGAVQPVNFASVGDRRFGNSAQTLGVESNSALFNLAASGWIYGGVFHNYATRNVWLLTINSTAAFTLTVNGLRSNPEWWEAEIIITTTQVPASFTFAGNATKRDVAGSTLADNPFEAGKVTVLFLSKISDGNYTAQFSPAVTVT